MDRNARDPLDTGHQGLEQSLALQIVHSNVSLGGQEEDWLRGMELHNLYISGLLAEWTLRGFGRQLVDQHGLAVT
jgi:hypothetical protein